MKQLCKCYLYFGFILLLCILGLVNYMMTKDLNGFRRMKSLGLDTQKFYCNEEIFNFESCKNQLESLDKAKYDPDSANPCLKYQVKMDKCKNAIKDNEKKVLDHCWTLFYDIFTCSENYKESGDKSEEWPCKRENDVIMECITGVVGKSIKSD